MKYFKDFENYNKVNELKENSQSLLGRMFSYLGNSISTGVKKIKLNNISKNYNKYLYIVFAEYVLEKELKLEQGELVDVDTSNIINKMTKITIPSEKNAQVETTMDKEEVVQEIKEDEKEEIEPNVITDSDSSDSDSSGSNIDGSNIDGSNLGNDDSVIPEGVNDKGEKVNISKYGITHKELKDNIEDINERPNIIRYLANIVTIDNMLDVQIEEIEEIEEFFKEYNIRKREVMASMRGLKPGKQRDSMQDEVDSISREMNYMKTQRNDIESKIEDLKHKKSEYFSKIPEELGIVDKMNENIDWKAGAVYRQDWTKDDKKKVTAMVNPYQIESYFIEAEHIIDDAMKNRVGDKKSELKNYWEKKINDVHKQWYYVYEIEDLRLKRKSIFSDSVGSVTQSKGLKKEKPSREEFKSSVSLSMTFEEMFGNYIKHYSSKEKYFKINSDKNGFYIMPFGYNDNMKLFLMKKEIFMEKERKFLFKIISELDLDENNMFYISKTYDDERYNRNLKLNNKSIELYIEEDDYPIIFIHDDTIFSGELKKDRFEYLEIDLIDLYSVDDLLLKKLINNRNSENLRKIENIGEDIIENIKKYRT